MSGIILHAKGYGQVYRLAEIYVPGVPPDPPNGAQVPAVGALVIDDSNPASAVLWWVSAVDPITHASTLAPFELGLGLAGGYASSYGNQQLTLFYRPTGGGPSRLFVDSKLFIHGDLAAVYTLSKVTGAGLEVPIAYPVGEAAPMEIPLIDNAIQGVKVFGECRTGETLTDGQVIRLRLWDANDPRVMVGMFTLTAKEASEYDDLGWATNPIVGLVVTPSLMDPDEHALLPLYGDPADLTFALKLVYADGFEEPLTVDGMATFEYGRDEIDTSMLEMTFPVVFKYMVPDTGTVDPVLGYTTSNRVLTAEVQVRIYEPVLTPMTTFSPLFWVEDDLWEVRWEASFVNREDAVAVEPVFHAGTLDLTLLTPQTFTIEHTVYDQFMNPKTYRQEFTVTLGDPSLLPVTLSYTPGVLEEV